MPITPIHMPDATAEPIEYKRVLLEIIGDQDPLEVIGTTASTIRRICQDRSERELAAEPEPGEWSAEDVVAHLFDVDIVYGFRWRLVLTETDPVYPGYDEKKFTPLPHLPFWPRLASFDGLRAANLELLVNTPRSLWGRTGRHSEQGQETFDEMVRKLAAHDLGHINQIERALEAARV